MIRATRIALSWSIALTSITNPALAVKINESPGSLWEKALLAKGGRELTWRCENILISKRLKYIKFFKQYDLVFEDLYVFPDRQWQWDDQRPSVFGLEVMVLNLSKRLHHRMWGQAANSYKIDLDDQGVWNLSHKLTSIQAVFLLESKWCQPRPLRMERRSFGLRPIDWIEAQVGADRFEYFFDAKTHLAVRVVRHRTDLGEAERHTTLVDAYDLGDYYDVDGIQMPRHVVVSDPESGNRKWPYKATYKINVAYDPDLFETPPSVGTGPTGWMKTK
jgi:hypothetical protein